MTRTVFWALPPEIEAADAELLREFDTSVRDAGARAAEHLACRVGCTRCCMGPFEITALDAARLLRGVAEVTVRNSDAGRVVVERALGQWELISSTFPGDTGTGVLSDEEAARTAFFTRFAAMPCPALDPDGGSCVVYPWRPLSCRTYGLPMHDGSGVLEPCALNFTRVSSDVVSAATIAPDPNDLEGELLERARATEVVGDTIVAAVLSRAGLR